MYCVSADWIVLPPYYVYPSPKPTAYDLLLHVCAARSSIIHCTLKGWMNWNTFSAFIDHFDNNVDKNDRPVILLIDSVTSHINMDTFTKAGSRGIEIYMLVPHATHLMQPLDKGVFEPLKKSATKQCVKTLVKIRASLLTKRTLSWSCMKHRIS